MNPAFFGLAEPPFSPTPDPRFLHPTPGHQEALAQLLYGVGQRKGFVLLTGEVGTGKTTLLHALRARLDGHTAVAFLANSLLPFDGILEYLLEDLGIAKPGQTAARRLMALQTFLIERERAGQSTVLILDEAQNLSVGTLEQIRLLSNFETAEHKLLQIVLAGQPELRARLDHPELRQLQQRIALRASIPPLTPEQTRDYVRSRLRVAGARDLGLFTDRALLRVARWSRGIPRLVNTLCDHCLVIAYADQVRRVDPDTVEEAIAYLEAGEARRRARGRPARGGAPRGAPATPRRWPYVAAGAAVAAGLGGLAAWQPALVQHAMSLGAQALADLERAARAVMAR
jgi:type II secretory pathway predicted ATPase ExeA